MIVPRARQLMTMLTYVGSPLLILVLYDLAVVVAYKMMHWEWLALPHIPLSLFGSAIGIIVAFRNQSAYARWWEARTLWGAVVNNSRSLARQVTTVMSPLNEAEAGELKEYQRRLVYHTDCVCDCAAATPEWAGAVGGVVPLLNEEELNELRDQKNVPLAIQQQMSALLRHCQVRGWIDIAHWRALDEQSG